MAQAPLSSSYLDIAVKKILVCQLRQIGDVLLAVPAVELLAQRFPGAEIHFFTEKKCAPMLQNHPSITKIWELDKEAIPNLFQEIRYYRKITAERFDLVVDFQQLPRIRWVVMLSNAPIRVSYPPRWFQRLLYTHHFQPEPGYAAHYKAGILKPLGITVAGDERPHLYLTKEERAEADRLLRVMIPEGERFISVDAAHKHLTRRWPARHFAGLMDLMIDAEPDLHFVLTHGPGEEEYITELRDLCRHKERVYRAPLLPLRVVAAIIKRAAMQLGNCSAPRHMAVAVGTPSFTILGSSGLGWTFPSPEHAHTFLDIYCRPCKKTTCPVNVRCMEELTPNEVFPKAMVHLQKWGKTQAQPME